MSINYKIILEYIKDISVEVPDADVLIVTRENITNYLTDIKISSKIMKNNSMEIDTKLIYYDKNNIKKKSHFEITYSTVIQIQNKNPNKEDLKKLILCDLQIIIFPKIKEMFQNILKTVVSPKVKVKNIDFNDMYKQKLI